MVGQPLTPADLEYHARLGISTDVLMAAGVRRVTDAQARQDCGIQFRCERLDGIWYPAVDPTNGQIRSGRLRRDHPDRDREGQPIAKYLCPADRHYLFFPPGADALLADRSVPLVLVEAEKSVLAVTSAARRTGRPLLAIGLGGCWGWKGTIGKVTDAKGARVDERGPVADLDRVAWPGRIVVILFDANAATNPKVGAARRKLAEELSSRGALVRIADVPTLPEVNGPDDFIGAQGDAALFGLLDTALPPSGPAAKGERRKQGREVQLDDPEPWASPVDGAIVLDEIAATCSRYVALPSHASTALALWVLHAYAFNASFASPFLAITSPTKRCGKTLLLIVLGAMVPRRLFASNVTPAALFRTIEKYQPTLLIDEADTFVRDNDELRGVLNSGHTRTTAMVIRSVGEDHDPRAFSTWCAKAIALIGRLPGTLADRAIELAMRRRTPGERIERLRQDRIDATCEDLRRKAARWATDQLEALRDADPLMPRALHDRAADCWRPLLAIADACNETWPTRARAAAVALSGSVEEMDPRVELLHDIADVLTECENDAIASQVLLASLVALDHRPWATWRKDRPLTPRGLATLLAPLGIHPDQRRVAGKVQRSYRTCDFADAFTRYLPTQAVQRDDRNESGPNLAIPIRDGSSSRHTSTSVAKADFKGVCHAITHSATRTGDEWEQPW